MKRTPLFFLLCLAFVCFSLFHLEPSNAESESSSAVLVNETLSQQDDKLKPVSQEVDSSKSTGVNFEPGLKKIPAKSVDFLSLPLPDVPSRLTGPKQFGTEKILSATSTNPNQDQNSDITVVASYQNDTSIPLRK